MQRFNLGWLFWSRRLLQTTMYALRSSFKRMRQQTLKKWTARSKLCRIAELFMSCDNSDLPNQLEQSVFFYFITSQHYLNCLWKVFMSTFVNKCFSIVFCCAIVFSFELDIFICIYDPCIRHGNKILWLESQKFMGHCFTWVFCETLRFVELGRFVL